MIPFYRLIWRVRTVLGHERTISSDAHDCVLLHARSVTPRHHRDGFHVRSVRKHVDGLERDDLVTPTDDPGQVRGERLRVAGNVRGPFRPQPAEHLVDDGWLASFPRR